MKKKLLIILPIFIFGLVFLYRIPSYATKYVRGPIEYTLPEKYIVYENQERTDGFSTTYYNPSDIFSTRTVVIDLSKSDDGFMIPNEENLEKLINNIKVQNSSIDSIKFYDDYVGKIVEVNGIEGFKITFTSQDENLVGHMNSIYILTADKTACVFWFIGPDPTTFSSEEKEIAESIKIKDTVLNTKGIPFTDVSKYDWYFNAAKFAYENNIIKGYNDYTFAPNDKVTRGMIVTILWRMEGSPSNNGKSRFTDVSSTEYYAQAVKWAVDKGIIHGYDGTTKFGPNDNILRQDLAGILRNYAKYKGKAVNVTADLTKFSDYKKVDSYAETAVKWAVGKGVITGNTNGTLAPKGNATRAEAAAMIQKYCNKVGK